MNLKVKQIKLRQTYMVLNSSLYSSSPLFSLISESNLSMSSLSINRNEPRADFERNEKMLTLRLES